MQIRRLTPADAKAFQALRLAALQEAPTAFASSYEEEREFGAAAVEDRLAARPDRGVLGLRQVNLGVNARNVAAIRLYESVGFTAFGCEPGAMRVDGEPHDELHMSLRLGDG